MRFHGDALRALLLERPIAPSIGVHDVFSASLVSRRFEGLFLSGFSFAALAAELHDPVIAFVREKYNLDKAAQLFRGDHESTRTCRAVARQEAATPAKRSRSTLVMVERTCKEARRTTGLGHV